VVLELLAVRAAPPPVACDRELAMIYVTGLVRSLGRIPTAQEICDELDLWNPELQKGNEIEGQLQNNCASTLPG